jgi:hypothetical protein
MGIKKLVFCFAVVALASSANAQVSIPKRSVTLPASSSSQGGVAVVAIPIQADVCTVSNGKCGSISVGAAGSSSYVRPWTSYFLGQTKSFSDVIMYRTVQVFDPVNESLVNTQVPVYSYTTVNIDGNGVVYARQTNSQFVTAIGTPAGYENINWTTRGACIISPTWSNNSNKLAGLPPDNWTQSGQMNGNNVGCGSLVESYLNPYSPG